MPKDIYQRPANLFVATFIGKSNVLEETKVGRGRLGSNLWKRLPGIAHTVDPNLASQEGTVLISIRPEELLLHAAGKRGGYSCPHR